MGANPKGWGANLLFGKIFLENCMKMKEIGPREGEHPWPSLGVPMGALALYFYRPQTKFAKVMFLQVSVCPQGGACMVARGEACMVAPGEGVRGCSGGACMVARGACMVAPGGHVWLLQGGMCGCSGGACMVAPGGVCGCSGGGHAWFFGGHAWFFLGVCMVFAGGACVVFSRGCVWFFPGGGACIGYDEIRSMSGRYASYWNAFLF